MGVDPYMDVPTTAYVHTPGMPDGPTQTWGGGETEQVAYMASLASTLPMEPTQSEHIPGPVSLSPPKKYQRLEGETEEDI